MASLVVPPRECKLKHKCPNQSDPLYNCWIPDCDGWMHVGCSELLMNKFAIPTTERPSKDLLTGINEPHVFCKKGCHTKWMSMEKKAAKAAATAIKKAEEGPAKKKKVPWEEDGSLGVLVEWITIEGNYAEYCGATGNKGKTKSQHHKELAALIKDKVPEAERTDKDVENKINHLERQFRLASDWANNTGQGVDNPGHFEEAVLKRCPLCRELEEVMGDHPNATPLATSDDLSDSEVEVDIGEDEVYQGHEDDDESGLADMAAMASLNNPTEETPPKSTPSVSSASTKNRSSSSTKHRVTASRPSQQSQKDSDTLSNYLGAQNGAMEEYRGREVAARETKAKARMLEAQAMIKRSRKEGNKVEKETEVLTTQASATLLREQKRLLEEGISQDDIDTLLPLRVKKK